MTDKENSYCLLPSHILSVLFLSSPSQATSTTGATHRSFLLGVQVCKEQPGLCHSWVQYPHRKESEEGNIQLSFQEPPNINKGNSCPMRWAVRWQVAQQGHLWEGYVLSDLERNSHPCHRFGGQYWDTLIHLFKPSNDIALKDYLWHVLSLYPFFCALHWFIWG